MNDKTEPGSGTLLLFLLGGLWLTLSLVALFAPGTLPAPIVMFGPTILLALFALCHAARQYGWTGALLFFGVAFLISNIYENMSIMTGFPFGKYHHLGWAPQIFHVPWPVGLFFFSLSYLGFRLAVAIMGLDLVSRNATARFGLPIVATFIIVAWDICYDPLMSHFQSAVLYEGGGGFFGVPLSNYGGWFLCCWTITQAFAVLYRPPLARNEPQSAVDLYGPAFVWTVMAAQIPVLRLIMPNIEKIDDGGRIWHLHDFLDSAIFLAAYTMLFVAITAAMMVRYRRRGQL